MAGEVQRLQGLQQQTLQQMQVGSLKVPRTVSGSTLHMPAEITPALILTPLAR